MMNEGFTWLAALVGVVSTAMAIIIGAGTLRQRRDAPHRQRLEALEAWRREVDEKLDRDNKKIKCLEDDFEKNDEFQRVALKALKGLVEAVAKSGGGVGVEAGNISREIDEFLIKR